MHLNSILFATMAMVLSTVLADASQYSLKNNADCLNICLDDPNGLPCPPNTRSTQLPNGCWTCCRSA
ncbi:uncharacterized protein APUU_40013A [Aspergillus puulaauensis]|uniref:Uncharacterized protein n=1 Tax=Aspergillus puulaauensis TaxID=1220207 RepID=A0A7R7XLP8_9EURO|nr:uncharacterized protein APUU_40013A [Aspergillus puulaauensis]BCS23569.1 hypothetical protein APUU_40013A [Aspergillus puulaauensis]